MPPRASIGAASGTPGDGASVEAYTLAVTNVTADDPPPDLGRRALRQRQPAARSTRPVTGSSLVQPECPGDAIATDRVLDLEFATPIKASDLEAFLQDGLDT